MLRVAALLAIFSSALFHPKLYSKTTLRLSKVTDMLLLKFHVGFMLRKRKL